MLAGQAIASATKGVSHIGQSLVGTQVHLGGCSLGADQDILNDGVLQVCTYFRCQKGRLVVAALPLAGGV